MFWAIILSAIWSASDCVMTPPTYVPIVTGKQEEMQQEQQSTGEYSDESSLVALIGYVPQFSAYTSYEIPDQNVWYSSQDIYGNITMNDNIEAFYDYARTNINNLESMTKGQPQIWR